jgi:hypothetical protein
MVGVTVFVGVILGVNDSVGVTLGVILGVGVFVGVIDNVGVFVGVILGVGVGVTHICSCVKTHPVESTIFNKTLGAYLKESGALKLTDGGTYS